MLTFLVNKFLRISFNHFSWGDKFRVVKILANFKRQLLENTSTRGINLVATRKVIYTSLKQFTSKNWSKHCNVGYHEVTKLGIISSSINLSIPWEYLVSCVKMN